ncbi:MAG: hypothetical protein QXY49_03160 [Thermofilaceae archaeon]
MGLEESIEEVRKLLENEDEVRERILSLTREIIRGARRIVFKVHGGDIVSAEKELTETEKYVSELEKYKFLHPRLFYTGSVSAALVEYVEARLILEYEKTDKLPSFEELKVEPVHYLLGLADFGGELRRLMVRCLSTGDYSGAVRALKIMEKVYKGLITLALPDALVPGLRRKVDILRGVFESSMRDLLYYSISNDVENSIRDLIKILKNEREI